jgi:predicted MFS family arabinose efflux permease
MSTDAASKNTPLQPAFWVVLLSAAAILMVTMGTRQSLGLYFAPINEATQMGIVAISFAMAVSQLVWGAVQPLFGILADRYGAGPVLVAGGLLLAAGLILTTLAPNEFVLVITLGVFIAAGAGAGSFSVLIGAAAQRIQPERRGIATGFINAGGSLGQFVFAPLNQLFISMFGWVHAMYVMAATALLTLPLARPLARAIPAAPTAAAAALAAGGVAQMSLREQLHVAARDRSYWLLHAGFFTCGFHIAFLVTHLPGEVGLCGLPAEVASTSLAVIGAANVVGSLWAGWMGGIVRWKYLLFWMYASRAVLVALYLAAPKTALTFYLFAGGLGFTWLATVPPTAGIIGKLFGVRYLATLFGLATFTHQIGGFFGAYLGGLTRARFGDYSWMWYADMALALAAAFVNLPIREAKLQRVAAVPA